MKQTIRLLLMALRQNTDGTTYTTTFEMTKVK